MFANSNPISQPRQQDDHQKPRNFYFSNFATSSRQDQERNNSTSNRSSISTNQNPNDMNIFRSGHRSMEHSDRQHSVQGMTNGNPIMTNRFAVTGNNTQNSDDPFNFFKNAPKNIPSSMQMRRPQKTPSTIAHTNISISSTQNRNTLPTNPNPTLSNIGKQYNQPNPFTKNINNGTNMQTHPINTINYNIGNSQQNNMGSNSNNFTNSMNSNGRLNIGNNSFSSFNTNSNNNVNVFTGNNNKPSFLNNITANNNTTNTNTNTSTIKINSAYNPFYKNNSSNPNPNTNTNTNTNPISSNSPFTPNPSLNRCQNGNNNNNQINNNQPFINNNFINDCQMQQLNQLQQQQLLQQQQQQQHMQQIQQNQCSYPYSQQQQMILLQQQQQMMQHPQLNNPQVNGQYNNQIYQQFPMNNYEQYHQQYKTAQQNYLNVFTHMLSQFCLDYKDYIIQNLPRKAVQADHIYQRLFNQQRNDFGLNPYEQEIDQIQEQFHVLHRKKRQKRIVVKVVPSLQNPYRRRNSYRRFYQPISSRSKEKDLCKMSYQQLIQRQLNSQTINKNTINNQQIDYFPMRDSQPEISQFPQTRKLQYIVDLRWVEQPDLIRKVFSKSTIQVSDLPTSQQIQEAILKDLKNKNVQFQQQFIFQQKSFKLKKIVPHFFKRWFYGERERQVRQFIVEASIYERKINLPEGYEYSPVKFRGFIVKDLKISNKFGSIVWVGKTDIKSVNFQKGITIEKLQVYCEIPVLQKSAIVQFFSLPQQCKDKQEDNVQKILRKLCKGCQFIEFNKIKRSWMIKIDFSKEQQ